MKRLLTIEPLNQVVLVSIQGRHPSETLHMTPDEAEAEADRLKVAAEQARKVE